jgi:pimeloyl-ACP methyl ester carboxylesterase
VRIRVRDVHLYFDVVGPGLVPDGPLMRERPAVVCLHGGPGFDHNTIRGALSALADVAQLVFLDQRGNGRSDRSTPDRWNLDTWIDDIPAFCEALELERPILLGQSFGGFVALGVAARYPGLPAKLIVSSSAGRIRMDRVLAMFERLGGTKARAAAERNFANPSVETREEYLRVCVPLYNPTPPDPEVMQRVIRYDDVGIHFWSDEIHNFDLRSELAAIRVPTLLVGGELDPITTAEDMRELAAAIPEAKLKMFSDAGHGAFREHPEETLGLIRDFILT